MERSIGPSCRALRLCDATRQAARQEPPPPVLVSGGPSSATFLQTPDCLPCALRGFAPPAYVALPTLGNPLLPQGLPLPIVIRRMDLALALTTFCLPVDPVVTRESATWPGALCPIVVHMAALAPSTQARLILATPTIARAERVQVALAQQLVGPAWSLVLDAPGSLLEDPDLHAVLLRWVEQQTQARQWTWLPNQPVLVPGVPSQQRKEWIDATTAALSEVQTTLPGLPWPRWAGPLVVLPAGVPPSEVLPDGSSWLARPALPLLRADQPHKALLCRLIAGLYLDLWPCPAGSWPQWLQLALPRLCEVRSRGEGPSPAAMHRLRVRAGAGDLTRLLRGTSAPDPDLALAVFAPLVHSLRRHRLPTFLELIRQGTDGETAIRIAYGLGLRDLIDRP